MSAPDLASSTTLPSLIKAHRGVLAFAIVLALASVFSVLLVYGEDPFALGRLVVTGIAYLVAIVLTVAWLRSQKSKEIRLRPFPRHNSGHWRSLRAIIGKRVSRD